MIRDLLHDTPGNSRADVCVVGAGAAGIVMAVELARRGKRVTLLDGGGRLLEDGSQQPYASICTGLPHRGLHDGRVRVLGGTTTLWGGQILELDALDFESRPWVSDSGWPFPKSELSHHYKRAIELEGLDSSLLVDEDVWNKLGMEAPEFSPVQIYLSRWCPQPNFAKLHQAALEGGTIDVWLHANAVEMPLAGEVARGVKCRTQTGKVATFTAAEYVFCLGAIESSRFFLQPREGMLPWNISGLLGRHFQDHIDCTAATLEPVSADRFHDSFDAIFLRGHKYNPKAKLDSTIQQSEELLQVGATFYSSSKSGDPLPAIKTTAWSFLHGRLGEVSGSDFLRVLGHAPQLLRHGYRYATKHRAFHSPAATARTYRRKCCDTG
jgi:choline dehydrogenase-like flavoprotein